MPTYVLSWKELMLSVDLSLIKEKEIKRVRIECILMVRLNVGGEYPAIALLKN